MTALSARSDSDKFLPPATQVEQLLQWASRWPERTWAVEGARGLGRLLAQQLLNAGEHVVDVQPKLAARVRLLNTGQVNKNDPNDARAVAVAALRTHDTPPVVAEDDTAVFCASPLVLHVCCTRPPENESESGPETTTGPGFRGL